MDRRRKKLPGREGKVALKKDLEQMLLYANAAASIVTTRKGAICSMPEKQEIESVLTSSKL